MSDLDARRLSFGSAAAAYAAHRPSYPDAAIEWSLAPAPGGDILDLGAGTGKLTASLVTRGHVVAVDPDPEMLAQLRRGLPDVDARPGSAEEIPLPDASVDAVVAGQSWHWVDPARALPEVARVLRPGGVLAALWNREDHSVEWVAGVAGATGIERPVWTLSDVEEAFPPHPAFGVTEHATFDNPYTTTTDGWIANTATHSWVLTAEPADARARLDAMRSYLEARPETSSGEFVLPVRTEVLRVLRK
jgi:SAM-dependent methyltransferase